MLTLSPARGDDLNWVVLPSQAEVQDGSLFLVRVPGSRAAAEAKQLKLQAWDKDILFYPTKDEKGDPVAEAVVGVPYLADPGSKKIVLVWTTAGEDKQVAESTVTVKASEYDSEVLKVEAKHVNPPPSVQERIDREVQQVHAAYKLKTRQKYWNSTFRLPINNDLTSVFGTKRVYNGALKSAHLGVDVRAKIGTPIKAPEAGVVALSKNLYYTGHTVLIDHGFGLITLYAHMDKRSVKVGQKVKRGDRLGLSGATGRVNGPHLHWGAILNEVKINPLVLIKHLKWPKAVESAETKS